MTSNRALQIAFLISLVTHAAVVSQNPGYLFFSSPRENRKITLNYVKTPPKENKTNPGTSAAKQAREEPLIKIPPKISMDKRFPPPFIDKDEMFKASNPDIRNDLSFNKPALIKPDIIAIKKRVSLPAVDLDKINNPSYINYYQVVREKIRRAAYQNYNRVETGEVYITFIISKEGYLNDIRLVTEKSSDNIYLKSIALASVQNAAPFPNFPKELDYPQLSFNVVISFEVE